MHWTLCTMPCTLFGKQLTLYVQLYNPHSSLNEHCMYVVRLANSLYVCLYVVWQTVYTFPTERSLYEKRAVELCDRGRIRRDYHKYDDNHPDDHDCHHIHDNDHEYDDNDHDDCEADENV